jgi:hypothetical protein
MEIILYTLLGLSIILNIILLYRGIRLVRNIEDLQDMVVDVNEDVLTSLETMQEEMKQIDIRGSFESDDEVGTVFSELKNVIERYKSRY